jgi:hypothetical protein
MDHKPKLLEQVRNTIRLKRYSIRTERAYMDWIKRLILFHHKRRPTVMGVPEARAFLSHLAVERHVAASTQRQALSALIFLYREVMKYPNISREWVWQYVFPSRKRSIDPRAGKERRHHVDEDDLYPCAESERQRSAQSVGCGLIDSRRLRNATVIRSKAMYDYSA